MTSTRGRLDGQALVLAKGVRLAQGQGHAAGKAAVIRDDQVVLFELGLADRAQGLFLDDLLQAALDKVLLAFLAQGLAVGLFEHGARDLARAEALHAHVLAQLFKTALQLLVELFGGDSDGHNDFGSVDVFESGFHGS